MVLAWRFGEGREGVFAHRHIRFAERQLRQEGPVAEARSSATISPDLAGRGRGQQGQSRACCYTWTDHTHKYLHLLLVLFFSVVSLTFELFSVSIFPDHKSRTLTQLGGGSQSRLPLGDISLHPAKWPQSVAPRTAVDLRPTPPQKLSEGTNSIDTDYPTQISASFPQIFKTSRRYRACVYQGFTLPRQLYSQLELSMLRFSSMSLALVTLEGNLCYTSSETSILD